MSATTAANDIWKLGPSRLSGLSNRTTAAAHATSPIEITERSRITASSTILVIRNARWVGIVRPVIRR